MNGTCGTCKHWTWPRVDFHQVVEADSKYSTPPDERPFDERYAEAQEADKGYGECTAVPMGPSTPSNLPLALVLDGSQYFAQLYTLPEFGCALHEEKP